MNSHQIDKFNMYLKVDDFFDDHTADTASHPQIAPKHTLFKGLLDDITLQEATASADNTGVAEDKAALRTKAEIEIFDALTAVSGFARDNDNFTLLRKVDFTMSQLQKLRDMMLYAHGKEVERHATAHALALSSYAYTAVQLATLGTSLSSFFASISEPKDAIEASAVAGHTVDRLFVQADNLLEHLDIYMDSFRFSTPALWDEYRMARSIDDAGGGSGSDDEGTASGTLMAGAMAVVLEFTYDGALEYTISNNGLGTPLQASLYEDGAPVAGATVLTISAGMSQSALLASWGPSGNQLFLHNMSLTQELGYTVSVGEPL